MQRAGVRSRENERLSADSLSQIAADIEMMSAGMARYVLATADYDRTDRLWPAHFHVFFTNPLNLAYGGCGPALFLREALQEVPAPVIDWLTRQPLDVESYPPGLYLGLAGVAYTFLELGLEDKAAATLAMIDASPLLYDEPGIFLGAAGWGLAALHFFVRTKQQAYLELAVQAGEHLLRAGEARGEARYWRCNQDGQIHYGFGYGASGIALFLLYLHMLTGREDFRRDALAGLEFDLINKIESQVGWQWKRFEDDKLLYPYWIHGSAGVGSILIRFYELLGIERYRDLAYRIGHDTFIKYSYIPSLFEGLSGIGEFMLDVFRVTGDETFLSNAFDIAETVTWFGIERPEGIAFPGRWLTRISNDYGTGAAGVGLFFSRLLRPKARLLVDLDIRASTTH